MHRDQRGPPLSREQRIANAQRLEDTSTVLINFAVKSVKKHPVVFSAYSLGLLVCLFFSGIALTMQQQDQFQTDLSKIDYRDLDEKQSMFESDYQRYYASKGWFSCDALCQERKRYMENSKYELDLVQRQVDKQLSDAKAKLGLLSSVGVGETRDLFWTRFAQGKKFAKNQSKWDALFIGMRSLRRDESMVSFILELLIKMLFNFTLGMIGTVVGFIFSLYSIISSYQAAISTSLFFFGAASLAAISFAMTWLFMLYGAAAGTVYVGARAMAANMRLEHGEGRGERNYRE